MKIITPLLTTSFLLITLSEGDGTPVTPLNEDYADHFIETKACTEHQQGNAWSLTWHDEFTEEELNKEDWNVLDDAFGYGNRNQHYRPENIELVDNRLLIHLREESSAGFPYTSGALTTKGKVSFQGGKLEVRAKLPGGKGLLPAIWLWNEAGKTFPEIDIAELNGTLPGQLWNVVHYEEGGHHSREFAMTQFDTLTDDFHIYGIEWHDDRIDFFVDRKLVFTSTQHVPKEPMYLFINAAIGGDWVGEPDSSTKFPQTMEIDWIRHYERN